MSAERSDHANASSSPLSDIAGYVAGQEVSRLAAESATRTGREQLVMLLQQRDVASSIAERFGNVGEAQRQGHVFEWMHELSFNLKAIAEDDDTRLRVTTWLGQPHAAADLRVYGPSGEVLADVQAKVVGGAARRLASADGLTATKYDGMQLLVPQDHVAGTQDLLDRRLAMPEGPKHVQYRDVADRLADRVQSGDLASKPVTTAELAEVARDPEAHLAGLIREGHLRNAAVAGGSAAVAAGLTTGLLDVAATVVKTGSIADVAWPEVARRAAKQALEAGVIACMGQGIFEVAQHASTGTEQWSGALLDGSLHFALANAVFDLAGVAFGVGTGRMTAEDAAWAAAETLTRSLAGWACMAVGQTLIPVPVVGAVVGRVVGQYGAAMLVQGLRLAVTAGSLSTAWNAEYEALLRHTTELQAASAAELGELEGALAAYDTGFVRDILPRLASLQTLVGGGHPDQVLNHLASITSSYQGTPLFSSMAEFDLLMGDDHFTLVLDLASREPGPTGRCDG